MSLALVLTSYFLTIRGRLGKEFYKVDFINPSCPGQKAGSGSISMRNVAAQDHADVIHIRNTVFR